MTIQTISLGAAPSGAGGDTFRSTGTKVNENFTNNTHAASRYVGVAAGNVMEVGAYGLGGILNYMQAGEMAFLIFMNLNLDSFLPIQVRLILMEKRCQIMLAI